MVEHFEPFIARLIPSLVHVYNWEYWYIGEHWVHWEYFTLYLRPTSPVKESLVRAQECQR